MRIETINSLLKRKRECKKEIEEINKKLEKINCKPYVIELACNLRKEYGSKWIDFEVLKKIYGKSAPGVFKDMKLCKIVKTKQHEEDKRKVLFKILSDVKESK